MQKSKWSGYGVLATNDSADTVLEPWFCWKRLLATPLAKHSLVLRIPGHLGLGIKLSGYLWNQHLARFPIALGTRCFVGVKTLMCLRSLVLLCNDCSPGLYRVMCFHSGEKQPQGDNRAILHLGHRYRHRYVAGSWNWHSRVIPYAYIDTSKIIILG